MNNIDYFALDQTSMTSHITLIFEKAHKSAFSINVDLLPVTILPVGLFWFPPVHEI